MGTNYYAVKKKPVYVKTYPSFHIGKYTNPGYDKFVFQGNDKLKTPAAFEKFLKENTDYEIQDEYGYTIKNKDFIKMIDDASKIDIVFEDFL